MLKIDRNTLLNEKEVNRVEFQSETYFVIADVAKYLNEDLSDVEKTVLPVSGEYKETATLEQIEKGRKQEKLSAFNEALLKMKNFKDK
ncbi:MAG: hypothetical protein DI539_13905 [Flavobacterium psychrophilum]|nr:MAG: hypothetical protein DI539_13905 [Flavobacterium psychrophilum]